MKRSVDITVLLLFSFLMITFLSAGGPRAHASSDTEASSEAPAAFVAPPPVVNEKRTGELDCSGCHGPGKTLPYLGADRFHVEAHAAYNHGFHAQAIQDGKRSASCLDCHSTGGDMSTILPASDPRSTINRANIAKTCGSCHGQKSVMEGTGISNRPFVSYQESVHARSILRGNLNAAVCTDCHNSHDIRPASDDQSPIFKPNISKTCGKCHSNISAEYNLSVHGQAVARGVSRSPVCTDCHGIHNIKPHIDPVTSTTSQSLATGSCAQCHDGVALSQEFGVAGGRVSSYQDSYHGLASKFGSKVAANCASCHGVHNILPSSDPRSMINASHLVSTCGQCHPGAGENFVLGRVHLSAPQSPDVAASQTDIGTTVNAWVRSLYLWLIFLVIGGMAVHNLLVWKRKAIHKRRSHPRPILRMTRAQRIQHALLLTSFVALVLTGFALKYPDSWLALLLGGSEPLRRISHRIAGVVMIVVGLFHLWYLAFTAEGRSAVKDMLPRHSDIADLIQALRYYTFGHTTKPKFGRFNYGEKAEYWAVVWGTLVMGLTGLMVWFKVEVFSFIPRWIIDVALTIHFYEAILATLAIVVWHLYNVIFDPDVYPLNWALVDGHVSEDLYQEEHELDYERLKSAQQAAESRTNLQDADDNDAANLIPSRSPTD